MTKTLSFRTAILTCTFVATTTSVQDGRQWLPKPQTNELRQAWIEQRHRAAPDVDWRQLDAQFRAQRHGKTPNPAASKAASILPNGRDGLWQELGSWNQAGRIVLAKLDPMDDTLWALADGGQLWTKPLNGGLWTVTNDPYRLHQQDAIELVLVDGKRRLVRSGPALGTRLQFSDDGGRRWVEGAGQTSPNQAHMSIASQRPDGPDLYRIIRRWDPAQNIEYMDVYHSPDGGEQAHLIDTVPGHLATLFAADQTSMYALIDDRLYSVSPDSLDFLKTLPGVDTNQINALALSGGTSHLYALYTMNNNALPVYRSVNGQAFEYRGEAPVRPFMHNSFAASIMDTDIVYMGGVNGYVSYDGGINWTLISEWFEYYERPEDRLHADIPAFAPVLDSQQNEILLIGTDGGLYTSDTEVTAVANVSLAGLNISQYYDTYSANDPDILFAGSQDQGFQRNLSVSDSPWFDQVISGDYSSLQSGDGGSSLWSVYVNFAMYSPAATAPTMPLEFWHYDFTGAMFLAPLVVDANDPTQAWLGGGGFNDRHYLHKLSWQPGSGITPFSYAHNFESSITAIATDPHHSNHLFVTNNDALFVSTDEGQTWSESAFPDSTYFFPTSIAVDPSDANHLLVSGAGYSAPGVYQSLNHGQTWQAMTNGLPDTLVSEVAFSDDGTLLFAATELGPYLYDTEQAQWHGLQQEAAPDQNYTSVEWVESLGAARFATYGRGVWQMTLFDGEGMVQGEQLGRGDRSGNAIAAGSNTVVSGAWFSKVNGVRSGAALIHTRSIYGDWTQNERLLPPSPAAAMRFGASVALCPDQMTAVIGSPGQNNKDGAAYIFRSDGHGHWNLIDQLDHPDGNAGTEFGNAVACTDKQLIVGAKRHKSGSRNLGAVFVYDRSAKGASSVSQSLFADDPRHGDRFGTAIAVDSLGQLIIGAPLRDEGGKLNAGAAYVFALDDQGWQQTAQLTADPIRAGDQFGASVAIDDQLAVVGAPLRNEYAVNNNGAVFAFEKAGQQWQAAGVLSSVQLGAGDKLGYTVAIAGEHVVAGAPFYDHGQTNAGAVLSFQRSGDQWHARWLRQAPTPQQGERLGTALAATGPRIFAGAEQRETLARRAGGVFVFRDDAQ